MVSCAATVQTPHCLPASHLLCVSAGSSCAQPGTSPSNQQAVHGRFFDFEYPERDARLQPQRILTLLGVRPGSSVADIGAGGGWFTVRAAQRVGSDGTVFAEDINPEAIKAINDRFSGTGV